MSTVSPSPLTLTLPPLPSHRRPLPSTQRTSPRLSDLARGPARSPPSCRPSAGAGHGVFGARLALGEQLICLARWCAGWARGPRASRRGPALHGRDVLTRGAPAGFRAQLTRTVHPTTSMLDFSFTSQSLTSRSWPNHASTRAHRQTARRAGTRRGSRTRSRTGMVPARIGHGKLGSVCRAGSSDLQGRGTGASALARVDPRMVRRREPCQGERQRRLERRGAPPVARVRRGCQSSGYLCGRK